MLSNLLKGSSLVVAMTIANYATATEAPPAYAKTVMELVSSKAEYPKMAKMRHQEGAALVKISVSANGAPSDMEIEKSSGFQSLDDAALNAVKAAAPFPAPGDAGAVVHGSVRFATE